MRRLIVLLMVMGLVGIGSAAVAAPWERLAVVPSAASPDSGLAELFPTSVDGQAVVAETWSGAEWVARFDSGVPGGAAPTAARHHPGDHACR